MANVALARLRAAGIDIDAVVARPAKLRAWRATLMHVERQFLAVGG